MALRIRDPRFLTMAAAAAALALSAAVAPGLAWFLTLPPAAASGQPGAFLGSLAVLLVLWLLGAAAWRHPRWFWPVLVAFVVAAWVLRDRLGILGDARLMQGSVRAFGVGVPLYRAPLAMKTLGVVGEAGSWLLPLDVALAMLSVGCGLLTAAFVHRVDRARIPGTAALLTTFLLPLGFVSWGHVETYPVFNAALAGTIALLARDYRVGRLHPPAVGAMALLPLVHYAGVLVPLAVVASPPSGLRLPRAVRIILVAAGAVAAGVLAWGHTVAGFHAAGGSRVAYLAEAVQGAAIALVPATLVLPVFRPAGDPFRRMLQALALAFVAMPFVLRLERGVFGDLDVLSLAVVPLATLLLLTAAVAPRGRRALLLGLLLGLPWLAAVLTAQRTSFGVDRLSGYVERAPLSPEARANGYEIVAFIRAERGERDTAVAVMTRAVETTPGNHRLWGGLGDLQLVAGDTAAAVTSLTRSLDSPRRPRSLEVLLPLLAAEAPDSAAALAARYPGDTAWSSSASSAACVAFIRLGRLDEAEAAARTRLTAAPRDDLAWFNLAAVLVRLNRPGDAAGALEQAVNLNPSDPRYREALNRLTGGQ